MTKKFNTRNYKTELQVRESVEQEQAPLTIAGYFALFDDETALFDKVYEKIAPGAFDETLKRADVRALIDHDTARVLGRTGAGTLALKTDERGLYGEITVNPDDTEAVNFYHRVKRGDVSQCSFGFFINEQAEEKRADGVHITLTDVELFEVSCVTFPAYGNTSIEARGGESANARGLEYRKKMLLDRLGARVND